MRNQRLSNGSNWLIGLVFSSVAVLPAFAQQNSTNCGSISTEGQYGPFDYRSDKSKLGVVESHHFTPAVEALIRGSTSTLPGSDLDYTLRAFPNHHKALLSMMRYGEKMKSPQPSGAGYPVECYFERALRFQPDDTVARMIYAMFLTQNSRKSEALSQLEIVQNAAEDNPFTHQNLGLLYFDLGAYPEALVQAHKAIELGLDRPDLREKLQGVGQWVEPTAASTKK